MATKTIENALNVINTLSAKENRNLAETVKLATKVSEIADKGILQAWSLIKSPAKTESFLGVSVIELIPELCPKSSFPTFAQFSERMPDKEYFTKREIFKCLASFNTAQIAKEKLARKLAAQARAAERKAMKAAA